MIRFNLLSQSSVRFWGLLCCSLLIGFTAIAQAGGPPRPQGKPAVVEPEEEEEEMEAEEATPAAPTSTPAQPLRDEQEEEPQSSEPPPRFPEPSAMMSLNGRQSVTVKLVNTTDTTITYQVIEGTGERTLEGSSQVELQGLPIPLNLTYRRQDGGLLLVVPKAVEQGVLEVRFQPTGNFFLDTRSLNITGTGSVFLN
ncbi:hypothetical protein [Lyngbya sp. PCC 8106]|uniref:hypothetical protein n=1 Tax=Lyngbya sp. (strain PCC 8106) TaxID=313612 RepID=UPI0000EAC143|nr:hypothetical protein [Lyngbya sp. PCC 8106]EAW35566.1 hypothetical protein L8106_13185 [Lyngbya sp. PCC 8106]